jgi:hypothetical protein
MLFKYQADRDHYPEAFRRAGLDSVSEIALRRDRLRI